MLRMCSSWLRSQMWPNPKRLHSCWQCWFGDGWQVFDLCKWGCLSTNTLRMRQNACWGARPRSRKMGRSISYRSVRVRWTGLLRTPRTNSRLGWTWSMLWRVPTQVWPFLTLNDLMWPKLTTWFRAPFRSDNGNRQCCNDKTYHTFYLECCEGEVKQKGYCSAGIVSLLLRHWCYVIAITSLILHHSYYVIYVTLSILRFCYYVIDNT